MGYQEGNCSREPFPRTIDDFMDEAEIQPI